MFLTIVFKTNTPFHAPVCIGEIILIGPFNNGSMCKLSENDVLKQRNN